MCICYIQHNVQSHTDLVRAMLSMVRGPNITVASGQTSSDPVILEKSFGDAIQVAIVSPDTMPEVPSIQLSLDFATDYVQQGLTLAAAVAAAHWDAAPAAATVGAAGALSSFSAALLTAAAFRITLGGAAAADRTFITYKQVENT